MVGEKTTLHLWIIQWLRYAVQIRRDRHHDRFFFVVSPNLNGNSSLTPVWEYTAEYLLLCSIFLYPRIRSPTLDTTFAGAVCAAHSSCGVLLRAKAVLPASFALQIRLAAWLMVIGLLPSPTCPWPLFFFFSSRPPSLGHFLWLPSNLHL